MQEFVISSSKAYCAIVFCCCSWDFSQAVKESRRQRRKKREEMRKKTCLISNGIKMFVSEVEKKLKINTSKDV